MDTRTYIKTKIPEGRRNNALFITALYAAEHDLPAIKQKAIAVDGLSEREAEATIRSARRYSTATKPDASAAYEALFKDDEPLCVVLRDKSGRFTDIRVTGGDLSEIAERYQNYDGDVFYTINPCEARSDKDVTSYRHILIECDSEPMASQMTLLRWLQPCVVCAYYSGSRSIHIICNAGNLNADDYKTTVTKFYAYVGKRFRVDTSCKNPSRLSRLPGVQRAGIDVSVLYTGKAPCTVKEFMLIDSLPESLRAAGLPKRVSAIHAEKAPVLIEGVVRYGCKVFVAGPAKIGKSIAMLSLASAMTNGGLWFNLRVNPAKVLYVNIEVDEYTLVTRATELTKSGVRCDNIDVWTIRGAYTSGEDVISGITTVAKACGYNAIIIDPIYLLLDGDESDAKAVSAFLRRVDNMIKATGATMFLVHHFPKGQPGQRAFVDRMSGSSYFARWADAIVNLCPTQDFEFELGIMSRVLPSPAKSRWTLEYPVFRQVVTQNVLDLQIKGIT